MNTKDGTIRNSLNSPLRIDSALLKGGGEIGMTICPGKHQADAITGTWERDLQTDVRAIADWGAAAVVTVMEQHELDRLKSGALGEAVENAGMNWHLLPIPDTNVPDEHFENLWIYSGHVLRRALTAGKKILIHCKGGLGRTGMIAARLMVELGEPPADAIKKVRRARPDAIENSKQEQHIINARPPRTDPVVLDRILGCLLGGAVGDAFGYEVEFDSWQKIKARFGETGITQPATHGGKILVSDDTQMTLFTLEALVRSSEAVAECDVDRLVDAIRLAYLDWLNTQGEVVRGFKIAGTIAADSRLRHRRAPGDTCLAALNAGGDGSPEKPLNDSKGCGGVMRVAPLGLLTDFDPAQVAQLAARAAALTHGNPTGYLSAAALAAIVRLTLDVPDLAANALVAATIVSSWKGNEETVAKVNAALAAARAGNRNHRRAIESLGKGWIGEEALAIALYSALVGNSFAEVLSIATNHGGDSDSTASIAGQLYGASKGLADLPNQWVRHLDVRDILLELIRKFDQEAN